MSTGRSAYPLVGSERDAWVLSRRGARNLLSPEKPYAFFQELEPDERGVLLNTGTVLLTNKECPFRCVMCDLWKNTLEEATPIGAVPRQIEFALEEWRSANSSGQRGAVEQIKLYNSGSFFDPQAIPPADYEAISRLVKGISRVVVECHPGFIGARTLNFAAQLEGRLEVAIGLETAHAKVLQQLNKRMTLEQFSRAAETLAANQIDLRVFLMIAPPFLPLEEALEWAARSVEVAFAAGARVVSLIPTRAGNGAMEELGRHGLYQKPGLELIECAFERALGSKGLVFLDLWDLEQFGACPICLPERKRRLHEMNLQQRVLPRIQCHACGAV